MELNPKHKTTVQARGHWHKIAVLILLKLGMTEMTLTKADVNKLAKGDVNIVLDTRDELTTGKLTIRIVDDKTAYKLALESVGLAIRPEHN